MQLSNQTKIIIPRAITRFGDHAWDLAVPILLIKLYPGSLDYVAAYSLVITLAVIFLVPKIASYFNTQNRLKNLNQIISAQVAGVGLSLLVVLLSEKHDLLEFVLLTLSGIAIRIGSSVGDLAIMSDWLPRIFKDHTLSIINSRLRRADLIMEVAGPLIAGIILLIPNGFELVASINLISFIVEWLLLKNVYQTNASELIPPKVGDRKQSGSGLWQGVKIAAAQPTFLIILAIATVWYTVLSPHGNLLAAHLKDNFNISEDVLGALRSCGALIGILPTLYYTQVQRKIGTLNFAAYHILFQVICLFIAALSLHVFGNLWISLSAIVISRIGLYGFLLSATEILQREVPENIRMEVNSVATSLKYSASMALYITALIWSKSNEFAVLSIATVTAIGIGTVLTWQTKLGKLGAQITR
jgi:iron-regulated transporter 1